MPHTPHRTHHPNNPYRITYGWTTLDHPYYEPHLTPPPPLRATPRRCWWAHVYPYGGSRQAARRARAPHLILSLPPCSLVCPTQVGALREAMEVKQQSTMYSTPLYQESGVAAGTNAPQAVAATDHADHNADHDNHDDDDDRDASQAAPLGVDSSTSPSPTTRRPRCPAQDLREVETLYVRLKELLRSQTLGTP